MLNIQQDMPVTLYAPCCNAIYMFNIYEYQNNSTSTPLTSNQVISSIMFIGNEMNSNCQSMHHFQAINNEDLYYGFSVKSNDSYLNNNQSSSIYKTKANFSNTDCNIYSLTNQSKRFRVLWSRFNLIGDMVLSIAALMFAMSFKRIIDYGVEYTGISQISYTPNGTNPSEIHWVGSTMNVRYFRNVTLFQDNNGLVQYQEIDVTSCLWPNYISELQTCDPELPAFVLENKYTIELSGSNSTNITLTAFEQCRSAKFLLRVCNNTPSDVIPCVTPSWILLNEGSGNFTIDTSKVTSVGFVNLTFQSQLVGYSMLNLYVNNTISTNNSMISFVNDNCQLISILTDWYVIVQQIKHFSLNFYDKENDNVFVSLVDSGACSVFAQAQNTSTFRLIVMCDDSSVSQTTIILKYTDKYHQDAQYWVQVGINLNIFKSQSPIFANDLSPIQINLCILQQLQVGFPEIIDVDSSLFNISLANSTADWIQIQTSASEFQNSSDNFSIRIDESSPSVPKSASSVNITVILSDDSGAFTDYSLNVEFVRSKTISFSSFDNISVNAQNGMQIPLNIGGAKLYASSCSTGQPIDWICYSESNQTLYVYNQTVCGFKFDGCDNSNMYGVHCVKLTSTDNCNNRIDSNEFNVTINASLPPSQANKVDPISVYQNHYVDVKLRDYLFVNQEGVVSNFDTSHCVNSNDVKVATRITANQDDGSVNLYVKVFGNKGCQVSVYTNSLFCQSSEALVDIVVFGCASKECFECSGPYESDCISCNSGYVLESGGSCVRDVNYLPTTNTKLYWICGLFAMIVTLIYVILSFKYGRRMLEPALHLQSLMMLVLSSDCVSSNLDEYLSWVQYFKFDFGFLNSFWLNYIVSCTPSDSKYVNAKLYCQETIFNYSNIFVFVVILFGLIKFIKIIRLSNLMKHLQTFEIKPQTTFVILWCLILPFMLVNVYYEFLNLSSHMMASFSMILAIVMFITFCILKRSSFMSNKFVQSIDQYKSLACIYLTLLIRVPLTLLLVASSRTFKIVLTITVLTMQCSLLFALISHKVKLPLQHNFDRATELFSNSVMLIVVMVSTVDKFLSTSSTECSLSGVDAQGINSDSVLLLLMTTMLMCYMLVAILKIASELIIRK